MYSINIIRVRNPEDLEEIPLNFSPIVVVNLSFTTISEDLLRLRREIETPHLPLSVQSQEISALDVIDKLIRSLFEATRLHFSTWI